MTKRINKHDTFFQWRKERRIAPILLEVLDEVQTIDNCKEVYQVRWHVMGTVKVSTSVFQMMATNGSFYGFAPIPRKTYLRATKILKETASYPSARRRILTLMKKELVKKS